jgi:conjugal transfer/entry exclusion protein
MRPLHEHLHLLSQDERSLVQDAQFLLQLSRLLSNQASTTGLPIHNQSSERKRRKRRTRRFLYSSISFPQLFGL